ncbi:uncharacterized protein PAC_04693 [Phialocephala subalpina]|uniref:Clr5 domain-containing protein n=1 Tax=Phialocephala subalpina TaxID=576137 RepID=A0A1L7WPV7_9HELO|nr:uncharacterized protein PAC_04693 [Phialocephala subalpina]
MNSTTNSVARDSDPPNFVPSNLQCRSQEPSASQTLHSENDLAARKNGMLSREQWENLKPIIRRLYIDENETIKSTSKYLGEHHNFEPTKRQLLRKISEWGFEKNVKRPERQVIIACEEDGLPVGETIRGRKFDKAKLKRWKNQEGGYSAKTQMGDFQVALWTKGGSNSVPGNGNSTNPSDTTTTAPNPDSGATSQVRIQQAQSEPKPDNATDWIVSEADIWKSVDVPGSPKLARLIGALTCFVDACSIPFLDIEASGGGVFEESANQSLADDDIMNFELEDTISFHSNGSVILLPSRLRISEPWLFENYHECQASSNFREASLCPGLSPFPTVDERQMFSSSSKLRFLTEKECITRLRTMRRTRIPDNELLENVSAIAMDYWDNEHYAAAEIWCRRLVSAKQSILWFKPIETLRYCLNVVGSKYSQSKYKEARGLHEDLHVKIMQRTWGRYDAIIKFYSMVLAADLLASFGNCKEEENVRRQVLQISLTTFGVKSDYTATAMARLGRCLPYRNRSSESEFLSYSTVHLINQLILDKTSDSESSNRHLDLSFSMLLLAKTWNSSGKLQEARRLIEVAIQKHRGTRIHSKALEWDLSLELFYNMHSEGFFVEAERILKNLLERLGGTVSPSRRTNAIYELGEVLSANCHHVEAASCFKEAFLSDERTFGLNHEYTMRSAKKLGLCFVNQGLYQEALAYYQEVLDRLHQMANEDPERTTECVQNVRRWMSQIKLEVLEAGVVAE